ncbi:MAG: hypothetical protein WC788_05230 [Candidatus Paceibacterota bacterium]|jgi:hypothetical protein
MRNKVTVPDEITDAININVLETAFKYIKVLRMLPAETKNVAQVLGLDMKEAETAMTKLDDLGLVSWHKNDGIVHRTGRTRTVMDIVKMMRSDIEPDAQKIFMKEVCTNLKKG